MAKVEKTRKKLPTAKQDGRIRANAVSPGGGQAQGLKQKQDPAKKSDPAEKAHKILGVDKRDKDRERRRRRRKRRACPLSAFEKDLYAPAREADYPGDWVVGEKLPRKIPLDAAMKLLFHPKATTAYKQAFLLLLWKLYGDTGPEILLVALQDHQKAGFPIFDLADLNANENSPTPTPGDQSSLIQPKTSSPGSAVNPMNNAPMPPASRIGSQKSADVLPDTDKIHEVLAAPTSSRLMTTSGPSDLRAQSQSLKKDTNKGVRPEKAVSSPLSGRKKSKKGLPLQDASSAEIPTSPICLPQCSQAEAPAAGLDAPEAPNQGCLPRIFDTQQSSSELLQDEKKDSFKELPRLSSGKTDTFGRSSGIPRTESDRLSAQSSLRAEGLEIIKLDSNVMASELSLGLNPSTSSLRGISEIMEQRPVLDSINSGKDKPQDEEKTKEENSKRPSKHLHLIELFELWIQNYPDDLQRDFAKRLLVWCKGLAREEWSSSQVRKDWQRVITGLRSLKRGPEKDGRDSKDAKKDGSSKSQRQNQKARLDKKVHVIDEYFLEKDATPRDFEKGGIDLLEVPTGLLAEQLTLMELEQFKKIKPRELTRRSWEMGKKPTPYSTANNIRLFSKHADKLSYMVATEILMQKKLSRRRLMMQKIYDLCAVMHDMKNYHCCLMLFHGIMLPEIHRLGRLRWLVREDKKFRDLDEKFDKLQDPDLNNQSYRSEFSTLFVEEKRGVPLLPYMPLFTKDLEKMDRVVLLKEGDEQMVNLINLRKHCLIIKELLICQNRCRQYRTNEPIPELQEKLREEMQKAKKPEDLKQLSVEVEPKLSAEQHNQAQLIYALQDFGFM